MCVCKRNECEVSPAMMTNCVLSLGFNHTHEGQDCPLQPLVSPSIPVDSLELFSRRYLSDHRDVPLIPLEQTPRPG